MHTKVRAARLGKAGTAKKSQPRKHYQGPAKSSRGKASKRADEAKLGHVRFLRIFDISPCPDNERIYKPIYPEDVKDLARDIRTHGVQEPLIISQDGYIISGHRRRAAAQLAGLLEVPCRMHDIRYCQNPEGFLKLLAACNRGQRVKSLDERVREEVLAINPENAYNALLEQREQQATVTVETIDMGAWKTRNRISDAKKPMLDAIAKVLAERRTFWPLSDRQIHYALLNDPPLKHAKKPGSVYRNDKQSYKALTDLLTRGRLAGRIPFGAIHDPTRPVTRWDVHDDAGAFVQQQISGFLTGYRRNLMRSQPNHIEIVVEKNSVAPIVRRVAGQYSIPVTSGRGYCSLPPRHEMTQRFEASGKEKLIVLLLTDFDPDGEEIAASFARSIRDDFLVDDIVPVKVALTTEQIRRFKLPPKMTAKKTSTNYEKFADRHGDNVFELEALKPQDLQTVLREAIESVVDRDTLNRDIAAEKTDAAYLAAKRKVILKTVGDLAEGAD